MDDLEAPEEPLQEAVGESKDPELKSKSKDLPAPNFFNTLEKPLTPTEQTK